MNTNQLVAAEFDKQTLLRVWFAREPLLARFCLVVLAFIPLISLGAVYDERTLHGINIWIKPLKFNISIAIYLGTLVWFSGWIDRAVMRSVYYRIYTYILVGSMLVLFAWLYSAALLGESAHYNRTHPIFAPLYSLMGLVSVIFTSGTVVVGYLIARNVHSPLTTYFRYAVVGSLIISFVCTVVIAGELASMDSHWIEGTPSDESGLPFFGWSRDGGDLRVAHFFSLHAMHVIPLASLLPLPGRLADYPRLLISIISLLYVGFILFVYFQAKQALPFLPWLG